jgi:LytTr DNA-binding domain
MSAFVSELRAEVRSKVPWVLWLLLSLVVAVTGPFGTYIELTFLQRLGFWLPAIGAGIAVSSVLRAFMHGALNLKGFRTTAAVGTTLICAVLSPPFYMLIRWVLNETGRNLTTFPEVVVLIASISLGVCSLRHSVSDAAHAGETPLALPSQTAIEPRVVQRLEPAQRGPLLAISVRDHYVDVLTGQGTSSLLLRFGDAIAEADPVLGAQVHRSHWVAWDAVDAVEREGAKLHLRLKSGTRVPVSKNNRDKLMARGLL